MANLVVNAVDVKIGVGLVRTLKGKAGAKVVAGETVNILNSLFQLASADDVATADVQGIAINSAEQDQPLEIIVEGEVILGAAIVNGAVYVQAPDIGKMVESDDVLMVTGKFVTVVGVGRGGNRLLVGPIRSGQALP